MRWEGVLAPPWGGAGKCGMVPKHVPLPYSLSLTIFRMIEERKPSEAKARGCRGPIDRALGWGRRAGLSPRPRQGERYSNQEMLTLPS